MHNKSLLRNYLDRLPRGGITEFAGRVGVTPIYLSQLAAGLDGREPSPMLALSIERASGGVVTRASLRPRDFADIWPDITVHL